VTFVIVAASAILNFAKPELLEGILPEVTSALSLFEKFYTFVNGVFDVTAIVYYLTVIVFFLFLSVQSLEKRRYN
jgi:ABC-2 type transport system permease protein